MFQWRCDDGIETKRIRWFGSNETNSNLCGRVSLWWRICLICKGRMVLETTNRNHSTYWIVNHWNPFKLVNIVSVILLANLNWRIYHNYNPFKLVQLEGNHAISMVVHLWFEVLNWYWIFEWLDLPNLQSIINSKGGSFRWPHSVIAKDTSEYWILIVFTYSKPSKCQAIWVIPLCTILINFEYCLFAWLIWFHS